MLGGRGQQGEMSGTLNRDRQTPLHFGRHAGAATGQNLALRRNVLLEALDVFVVGLNAKFCELALAPPPAHPARAAWAAWAAWAARAAPTAASATAAHPWTSHTHGMIYL